MFASTLPLAWRVSLMLVVGLATGVANGVAGGGTFITFPTMLALGIAPLTANVSTAAAVCPSYVGEMWRYRSQITPHRRLLLALLAPCGAGAGLGCALCSPAPRPFAASFAGSSAPERCYSPSRRSSPDDWRTSITGIPGDASSSS